MKRRWLLVAVLPLLVLALLAAPTMRGAKPSTKNVEPSIDVDTTTISTATETTAPTPDWLAAIDLPANPETAPAVIHSVAEMPDRDTAARTLARWLREESLRDTADARGNVPNLIEALGETGGDVARAALIEALEDRSYDLALQTLIVQQLGERAPRDSLARFAARAEKAPTDNEFEIELRNEALAAARRDL
jgi:hypothetical protein